LYSTPSIPSPAIHSARLRDLLLLGSFGLVAHPAREGLVPAEVHPQQFFDVARQVQRQHLRDHTPEFSAIDITDILVILVATLGGTVAHHPRSEGLVLAAARPQQLFDVGRKAQPQHLRDHNPKLRAIDNPVVANVELGFDGDGGAEQTHAWSQLEDGGAEQLADGGHFLRVDTLLLSSII
jgi:hypothetical protein